MHITSNAKTTHWPQQALFIEELPSQPVKNAKDIAWIFGFASYVHLMLDSGKLRLLGCSEDLLETLHVADIDQNQFYPEVFASPTPPKSILRLRNPIYPLPTFFAEDIAQSFPAGRYSYVLSQGGPYGLEGFFAERMTAEAFNTLTARHDTKLLPNGCFNGLTLADSARYFFPDKLQRYYLLEHFDTLFDSPRALVVDTVSRCNYACPKCPFHSTAAGPCTGDILPAYQYARLLEKMTHYKRLSTCAPTLTGEPLLHPQIVELTRLTRQAGYNFGFTTNASLLTPKLADSLLEAGVGPLAFSMDAVTQQTYRILQQGHLARVEQNILDFQAKFRARYGYFLGTMSFVVSPENAHEQEAFRQKWLDRGFHVTFFARHDWQRHMHPYTVYQHPAPRRSPCLASWHTLFLNNAMQAVTCSWGSKTNPPQAESPSLTESDSTEFWRQNPVLTAFRLNGTKLPRHCGQCTCWADMQTSLLRNAQGELISYSLGSVTYIPSAGSKKHA